MSLLLRRAPARFANIPRTFQTTSRRFNQHTAAENPAPKPSTPEPPHNATPAPPPGALRRAAPSAADYQAEIVRRAKAQGQTILNLQPKTAREAQSDNGIGLTAIILIVSTPFAIYFYYEYRKKHMDEKRLKMLGEAQERYRRANGG